MLWRQDDTARISLFVALRSLLRVDEHLDNRIQDIFSRAKTREGLKVVADQVDPRPRETWQVTILNVIDGICFRNTDVPGTYLKGPLILLPLIDHSLTTCLQALSL